MRNWHLFIVVDKASKFMSTYLLESKEAECAARNLLGLAPTFGVLLSLHSDTGIQFFQAAVTHLCRWLYVNVDNDR